jgi:Protein of unknown function (DUF3732)
MGARDLMQLEAIVLYHRDGERQHEVRFLPGELNVITGISDTGKSAVVEIVDFCLGSDEHGVYAGRELDTIGWYGLRLRIDGQAVFVARQRPPRGQKSSDRATIIVGNEQAPAPVALEQTTNIDQVTAQVGQILGIHENRQDPPEGSTRDPVAAQLRHAMPYVLQPQRLIADPRYLFDGQENHFKAQHIRDTLPYFLGAVDQDALAQRRELRLRRTELRQAQAALNDAEQATAAVVTRARVLLADAQRHRLAPGEIEVDAIEVRRVLKAALAQQPEGLPAAAAVTADQIAVLQDRKNDQAVDLRELRAQRRTVVRRVQSAAAFAAEAGEQRARLMSLQLLPEADEIDRTCPLCGSDHNPVGVGPAELRHELQRLRTQTANLRAVEPALQASIDGLDGKIAELRGRLDETDRELQALVARDNAVQQARGRLEEQAYLRGRIAEFLNEHPAVDPEARAALQNAVTLAEARVTELEAVLSADTTRRRTENALSFIGTEMTAMAAELGLSYSGDGVELDPVALTVVARDPDGPLWLNKDIGSGGNWVGYHLVTLLALQRHFIGHQRPVPRMLLLDQPTQAFFPRNKREATDRQLSDLPDEDRQRVDQIFELLRATVRELEGTLQIIVMDHVEFDDAWFEHAVGDNRWRGGRGLVPDDWYADSSS